MSQILDYRGNPVQSKFLSKELASTSLAGVRTVWDNSTANGLTPYRLAALLQGAAAGDANDFLTLAEEMEERDLHYRCEIGKRRLAVSSLPVTVEAVSDEAKDVSLADEVMLLTKKSGFRGLLKDLLDALGKGYSVAEIIWNRGTSWTPERYEWRDPRFFIFDRESRKQLRLIDSENMAEGIELAPYKFIVHLPHLKTGIPIRGGLARVAALSFLLKNYAVKDWMAFAEVFGMPLRLGKYQTGSLPADVDILKMAVANLGIDAAAVIPESMQIEFIEAGKSAGSGGSSLFLSLADWLDTQVSRGILGQSATTSGTPGKLGSDEAQAEVRADIRDDDATQLAETLNRDLVRPFIDLNFGPQENYPELILRAIENENLTIVTQALKELIPLGLKVEQSVIRDKFGFPEPANDAELLAPAKTPVVTAKNSVELQSDESSLFSLTKKMTEDHADELIIAAEALLGNVESLAQFRERLIDLYAATNPDKLAVTLARIEILSNLAGRLSVA